MAEPREAAHNGGRTRGREVPKGPWVALLAAQALKSNTYATAYYRLLENFAKVSQSEMQRLRRVGSHVACLLIMFFNGRLTTPALGERI